MQLPCGSLACAAQGGHRCRLSPGHCHHGRQKAEHTQSFPRRRFRPNRRRLRRHHSVDRTTPHTIRDFRIHGQLQERQVLPRVPHEYFTGPGPHRPQSQSPEGLSQIIRWDRPRHQTMDVTCRAFGARRWTQRNICRIFGLDAIHQAFCQPIPFLPNQSAHGQLPIFLYR